MTAWSVAAPLPHRSYCGTERGSAVAGPRDPMCHSNEHAQPHGRACDPWTTRDGHLNATPPSGFVPTALRAPQGHRTPILARDGSTGVRGGLAHYPHACALAGERPRQAAIDGGAQILMTSHASSYERDRSMRGALLQERTRRPAYRMVTCCRVWDSCAPHYGQRRHGAVVRISRRIGRVARSRAGGPAAAFDLTWVSKAIGRS